VIELLLQAERAMSVGLIDRAETLYVQVSEADPQNSIAVVGLARVALERGDEPGALDLARRALSIDPENAAASRMVERLEEVLRYRGEPIMAAAAATPTAATPSTSPSTSDPAPPVVPPQPPEPILPDPIPPAPKRRSLLDRLLRRR
jgi:thioredoxin-like negative regulator of GroEL